MQSEFLFSWKIMAKNIELEWMISKAFYARQHESKYKLMRSIHNLICSIEKKPNRIYKLSDIFPFSVRTYSSWTFYFIRAIKYDMRFVRIHLCTLYADH